MGRKRIIKINELFAGVRVGAGGFIQFVLQVFNSIESSGTVTTYVSISLFIFYFLFYFTIVYLFIFFILFLYLPYTNASTSGGEKNWNFRCSKCGVMGINMVQSHGFENRLDHSNTQFSTRISVSVLVLVSMIRTDSLFISFKKSQKKY